jgi:hypothetical protein
VKLKSSADVFIQQWSWNLQCDACVLSPKENTADALNETKNGGTKHNGISKRGSEVMKPAYHRQAVKRPSTRLTSYHGRTGV